MFCDNCRVKIPYDKAPELTHCSICGKEMIADVRDILELGKYGIAREIRPTQVKMAQDIETLLQAEQGTLLAEGGTGIGKSFAYLIPSLLAKGKRVVISTAKKTLQDQLINKDIPFIIKKLNMPNVKFGVYKGKSNYACWKLKQEVPTKDRAEFNRFITAARQNNKPADIANWKGPIPYWWSKVSIENCVLARSCVHQLYCKPHPKDYNIVVTNHHLMAIDLKIRPGTLLGIYNTLVLDEAHQAPEAFRSAYSKSITFKQLARIENSLKNDDHLRGIIDDSGIITAAKLVLQLETIVAAFKDLHSKVVKTAGISSIVDPQIVQIKAALSSFQIKTEDYAGQLFLILEDIERLHAAVQGTSDGEYSEEKLVTMLSRATKLHKRVSELSAFASTLLAKNSSEYLTTYDEQGLHLQPLDIGRIIAGPLSLISHKIILSATLAMGNDFEFSKQRLGLTDELRPKGNSIIEKIYPSPFDLRSQAILYIPRHLPLPVHNGSPEEKKQWVKAIATEIAQLLSATKGDGLVLFSAKTDMNNIIDELGYEFWDDAGLTLIQHEGEATATLAEFMKTPNSVLFGLKSFWEGVDIKGDKLKIVIIPKLPFPNPKDPLITVLSEKAGNNSFMEVMVPHMFFDMKQGVGRLIRSQSDRGFVAILDPRIWTGTGNRTTHIVRMEKIAADPERKRMGYGKKLLDVLGFTKITDDFTIISDWVNRFFKDR